MDNNKEDKSINDEFNFIAETSEEEKELIRSMTGNNKIWNYFLDLIRDKTFQNAVRCIKKTQLNEASKPKNDRDFTQGVRNLCRNFGLDEIMWLEDLEQYILTNELPKQNLSTPCMVFDRIEMGEDEYPDGYYEDGYDDDDGPMKQPKELEPWSYSHPVIIRVSPYASQREIIDYIKKSYTSYIKPIQERHQDERVYLGKVRKKKQSIQKRNDFIYENRHLPRKEIMRLVTDSFKETLDYGHIGKIVSLEKKKRENK